MTTTTLRSLGPDDAATWLALRLRALRDHPRAFLASVAEDERLGVAGVAQRLAAPPDRAVVIGAYDADALVGVVGVARDGHDKMRHCAVLWGMYVAPSHRRHGVGRALVAAAIAAARAMPGVERLSLAVDSVNLPAKALYQAMGFVSWGVEPDAFRVDGASVDDEHMLLDLGARRVPTPELP